MNGNWNSPQDFVVFSFYLQVASVITLFRHINDNNYSRIVKVQRKARLNNSFLTNQFTISIVPVPIHWDWL